MHAFLIVYVDFGVCTPIQLMELKQDISTGLAYINEAIDHTPTLSDLYVAKATLLRMAGDLDGAAATMDCGRQLDLADRFVNVEACKHMLACGQVQAALDTVKLFMKVRCCVCGSRCNVKQCPWCEHTSQTHIHDHGARPRTYIYLASCEPDC